MTALYRPCVILAALAFDETDDTILREAAQLAEYHPRSELHVVHAIDVRSPSKCGSDLAPADTRLGIAPEKLRVSLERAWPAKPIRIIAHLCSGRPAAAVLQVAAEIKADLIVLGARCRAGRERLVAGSVERGVLLASSRPVLVALHKDPDSSANPRVDSPNIALRSEGSGAVVQKV